MKKINWRYAIGELLIVIIGISVAFALNNWSASLKENDLFKGSPKCFKRVLFTLLIV